MTFSDTIKKLIKNKEESDDTLPSDEVSISVQNEIENKLESINSGITEIYISILRIFDSVNYTNKMSKNIDVLEKPKTKKKNIVKNNTPEGVTRKSKSNALLFAAIAIAITMLLDWLGGVIENIVNSVRDAINSMLDLFYDTQLKFVDLFYNMEKGIVADLSYFVNTTIDLAYEASSAALSAFYGTITIFSSSEKKEKIQKEIEEFKAEGIKQRNYNISVTAKTTAEITSSQTLKKQNIEVSRISAKTTVDEGAQTIVTALKPTNIFSGVKSFFGGYTSETDSFTGQPLKDRTVGTSEMTNANEVISFFQGKGFTKEQSIGIAANIYKESSFNPNSINEAGGNLGAYGLAQWRGDRQGKNYAKWAKKTGRNTNMRQSSKEDQLEYINFELTEGAYTLVGSDLKRITTIEDATKLIFDRYEVVGDNTLPSRIQTAKAYYNRGSPQIIIATTNTPPPKVPQPPRIKPKIVVDTRDVHGIKDKHPPKDNHNGT